MRHNPTSSPEQGQGRGRGRGGEGTEAREGEGVRGRGGVEWQRHNYLISVRPHSEINKLLGGFIN